jgi:hypothetical protein
MKPYFDTNHAARFLILVAFLAWGTTELAQRSQQQERTGATRIGRRGNRQMPRRRTYRPAGRRISP